VEASNFNASKSLSVEFLQLYRQYDGFLESLGFVLLKTGQETYYGTGIPVDPSFAGDVTTVSIDTYRLPRSTAAIQIITQFCRIVSVDDPDFNPPAFISDCLGSLTRHCLDRFDLLICSCFITFYDDHFIFGCRNGRTMLLRELTITPYILGLMSHLHSHQLDRIEKYIRRGFILPTNCPSADLIDHSFVLRDASFAAFISAPNNSFV
jgi:hypothetical protein